MFAIQIDTTGKPYNLFVARYVVNLSGYVRDLNDTALRTWRTRAGADRALSQFGQSASVVEIDGVRPNVRAVAVVASKAVTWMCRNDRHDDCARSGAYALLDDLKTETPCGCRCHAATD